MVNDDAEHSASPIQQSDGIDVQLSNWLARIRINIDSHNLAERRFVWLDNFLGAVGLVSIVALGSVATSVDLTSGWKVWVVVAVTAVGAIATALQTQIRPGSSAIAHQSAARQYARLRRSVEVALASAATIQTLVRVEAEWNSVAATAPNVPQAIRNKAKRAK